MFFVSFCTIVGGEIGVGSLDISLGTHSVEHGPLRERIDDISEYPGDSRASLLIADRDLILEFVVFGSELRYEWGVTLLELADHILDPLGWEGGIECSFSLGQLSDE